MAEAHHLEAQVAGVVRQLGALPAEHVAGLGLGVARRIGTVGALGHGAVGAVPVLKAVIPM